jgi:hypothetical protein
MPLQIRSRAASQSNSCAEPKIHFAVPRRFVAISVATSVTISTAARPGGVVGIAYSQTLTATGGSGPPSTWEVFFGTLPFGLTLNPSSGAPHNTITLNNTMQVLGEVPHFHGIKRILK